MPKIRYFSGSSKVKSSICDVENSAAAASPSARALAYWPSHMRSEGAQTEFDNEIKAVNGLVESDLALLARLLVLHGCNNDATVLARRLIDETGSFAAAVHSQMAQVLACGGDNGTYAALALARELNNAILRREVETRPVLSNESYVVDYLHANMAHLRNEQIRVLYLDTRHRLIRDEVHANGMVNKAYVYPREIIRRALELGAVGLVLAHNHPSGEPTPSRDDIVLTKEIIEAGRHLCVRVLDHLVLAREGHVSMRGSGLI